MTLTAFLAAWLLHLVAAASPGPTILMSARIGVTEGMRTGAFYALGCGIGALVWATAALFGLAVLFQVAPALLIGFKLAGGLFLLWIALQMWRHAPDPVPAPSRDGAPRSDISATRFGLATQLANPKPAIFFGAVFVGTIPPEAPTWTLAALLAAIFVNETVCTAGVARIFSFETSRAAYARLKSSLDRVFGGILGLLGIKIALT
ncbi:MAG: LysE family translocator [Silicimonas sp.]|jgi:threonine/homoserine/homoserine lactone efflux protein|nr:LysE family translocator [Silicimonas sp.]